MQKWEYCVLGPIKFSINTKEPWEGAFPCLVFLTTAGKKVTPIKGRKGVTEDNVMAEVVANLGTEGWELAGTGSIGGNTTHHYLYFKRPIS